MRYVVGTFVGTPVHNVDDMVNDWPVALTVNARGSDMVRVRPRHIGTSRAHLAVRTGPLVVYCLDAAAVDSAAAAWALAHAASAHLLPVESTRTPRRPKDPVTAAATDAVLEGPQRWDVIAPRAGQPFTIVSTHWLTVRVHDLPALETQTHAWMQACALGAQFLRTPPSPFNQLLRTARDLDTARRHRLTSPTHSRGR